jgi:hypothetical protein
LQRQTGETGRGRDAPFCCFAKKRLYIWAGFVDYPLAKSGRGWTRPAGG